MSKDKPRPETVLDLQGYFCDALGMKPDQVEQFFEFVDWPNAIGARFKRYLPEGFRELAALVKSWGGEYDRDRRQFTIPKVAAAKAPSQAPENIIEGFIERVETSTDKKWTLVYVANITRPLAIKPDLATPGLKPGNKIKAEVDIGRDWMFIRSFDIIKEEPAKEVSPPPPQPVAPTTTTPSMVVVKPEPSEEDEAAYLRRTYEKLGALSPVLRAKSGDVIDGLHRLQVDPGWYSLNIHGIDDPVKLTMARLVINVCRRQVPAEEKTQLLSQIAKLTGWTPQQISEAIGMSYTWVMKYLPDEFKQRPGVGPSEYPVTRRVTEKEVEIGEIPEESIGEPPEPRDTSVPMRAEGPPSQPITTGMPGVPVVTPPSPPKDILLDRALNWYQTDLLDFVWERVTIPERRQKFLKVFSAVEHELIVERGLLEEAWEKARLRFEKPEEITV